MLFLFVLTNVVIVSRFGEKRPLNALNVRVTEILIVKLTSENEKSIWTQKQKDKKVERNERLGEGER